MQIQLSLLNKFFVKYTRWHERLLIELSAIYQWLSIYPVAHICSLFSVILIVGSTVLLIRFSQCARLVRWVGRVGRKRRIAYKISRFYRFHTTTVVMTSWFNQLFGSSLLRIMVIYGPLNAFSVMTLLLRQNSLRLFSLNLVAAQAIPIFCGHFLATRFTKAIHVTDQQLLHLSATNQKRISVRTWLKLSLYVQKFHVKKQYGITYGPLGLVTMRHFVQVWLEN